MSSLIGSRAKVSRAIEQIDNLGAQLRFAMESDANKLLLDTKNDVFDGHPAVTIFATRVPVFSAEISVLIGEIVHNLRSSLDNLAWFLVPRRQLNLMNVRAQRQIAFPLAENRKSFWSSVDRRVPQASSPHIEFIEQYQPYRRSTAGRLMRSLRTLSNTDKHRFIVTALFLPARYDVSIELVGARRGKSIPRLAPGKEIKLGTELNTWTFTAKPKEVRMEYKITCFPAFSPSLIRPYPASDVANVRDTLSGIAALCTEILNFFDS